MDDFSADDMTVGRMMVKAALSVLGDPVDWGEVDQNTIARLVVKAMVAADRTKASEEQRLSDARGGRVFTDFGAAEALATAYWIWADDVDIDVDLDEVHPACAQAQKYMAFAQGIVAANLVTEGFKVLGDSYLLHDISDYADRLPADSLADKADPSDPNRALADEMWARIECKKPKA